ncbi:MAG: transporter substrate-binding domain-containing protein [Clostridia bacterium]|nr:transporter substrate-binding domain-containing protein [Clostridia bacterium]
MKKFLIGMTTAAVVAATALSFTGCSNDTLTVYTEAGFAPFEYVSNGEIVGVDVDIMNKVGEKLGKKVVFENVSFDTIVDAVAAGKLTNVGAAGISVTDDRKAKVDFSTEYYTANLYVIYPASDAATYESTTTDGVTGVYWESMTGKTIGIQGGTTADIFLADELVEGGSLYDTETSKATAAKTTFQSLNVAVSDIGKNTSVVIIDELPAQQLVKGKDNLKCAPLYYKGGEGEDDEIACDTYAIAVTKGQTALLNAINEVLEELGKDGIQQLVNTHLGL